jgi:hypothetical protein
MPSIRIDAVRRMKSSAMQDHGPARSNSNAREHVCIAVQ